MKAILSGYGSNQKDKRELNLNQAIITGILILAHNLTTYIA